MSAERQDERVRARVVVSGRVQGVYFRAHARDQAQRRGLAGWVRNRSDGRVEVAFEGPRPEVEDMVAWCRHGSRLSVVTEVQVVWEEPEGVEAFRIRG